MRNLLLIGAVAALSGCAQPAEEPAAETETEVAAAPAAAATNIAADGGPSHGIYDITRANGDKFRSEVKEDGTYTITTPDGKVIETGTWKQKSPESYCETSSAAGAQEKCFQEKFENGVYTSTDPETGETATVVRVES